MLRKISRGLEVQIHTQLTNIGYIPIETFFLIFLLFILSLFLLFGMYVEGRKKFPDLRDQMIKYKNLYF